MWVQEVRLLVLVEGRSGGSLKIRKFFFTIFFSYFRFLV